MTILRVCTVAGDAEAETELARTFRSMPNVDLYMRCTDRIGTIAAIRSEMVDAFVLVGDPGWFDEEVAAECRKAAVNLVGITSDVFEAESLLALGCLLVGRDARPEAILTAASAPGSSADEVVGAQAERGSLVAVWGPKGAPGATTVAIELAYICANLDPSVVLVDADTYGADCVQMMGVEDELPSLVWACRSALRSGSDGLSFLSELRRVGPDGPVLVPGVPRPSMWNEVSSAAWGALRAALQARFRRTIVDVGSCIEADEGPWSEFSEGRNHIPRGALDDADRIVAVVDASPTGIKHFIDAFDEVRSLNRSNDILIVANRVDEREAPDVTRLLTQHCGGPPAVHLPDVSAELRRARALGRSLMESRFASNFVSRLEAVAGQIGMDVPPRGLLARLSGRH